MTSGGTPISPLGRDLETSLTASYVGIPALDHAHSVIPCGLVGRGSAHEGGEAFGPRRVVFWHDKNLSRKGTWNCHRDRTGKPK